MTHQPTTDALADALREIADDFFPSTNAEAGLALEEMRRALQSVLAQHDAAKANEAWVNKTPRDRLADLVGAAEASRILDAVKDTLPEEPTGEGIPAGNSNGGQCESPPASPASPPQWASDAARAISEYFITGMHHSTAYGQFVVAGIVSKHAPAPVAVADAAKPDPASSGEINHFVSSVTPINGGMGPNWDEVKLKTGHVLQISDEGITVWPNEAAYQSADNANVLAGVSFDFPASSGEPGDKSDTELLEWLEQQGQPETFEDAPHKTVWCIIGCPGQTDLRAVIRSAAKWE